MCGRKRNGESMDFRSLTYFVTVAEELNITHAAEKLNLSQPPLSTQIRQLEEELGAPLFIRGRRSLQLTDAGRTLYRRAQQILSLGAAATVLAPADMREAIIERLQAAWQNLQ